MSTTVWRTGRLPWNALALALGVWVFAGPMARADDWWFAGKGPGPRCPECGQRHTGARGSGCGTLGYGPPGSHPGFQGFGLGYHPGYGYGGSALGVGAEGGYPFFGGPGYPHPWPTLQRIGGINPFVHDPGPGGPTPEHPNYFGGVGPLAPDQPVIFIASDYDYAEGYGAFTGVVPYPESVLAPFTTRAGAAGSASGVSSASPPNAPPNTAPAPGEMLDEHAATRSLGIDAEAFTDPSGGRGLRITRVQPGSPAQKAGLRNGDVIRSMNGHVTEVPSHLTWIITNAAPNRLLKLTVRVAGGEEQTFTIQLP